MGWRDTRSIIDGDVSERRHEKLSPVPDNEVSVGEVPATVLSIASHPLGLPAEKEPLPPMAS